MRKPALLGLSLVVLACCVFFVVGLIVARGPFDLLPRAEVSAPIVQKSPAPRTPVVLPAVQSRARPAVTNSTLQLLLSTQIPPDDPIDLVRRLKGQQGTQATPASPHIYSVGDETTFWVMRDITGTYQLITATLRYVTPHSYMWLENGETVPDLSLKQAGDTFENKVYPTDRRYFGSEPNPGVDNDPHVFILNTYFRGALGYLSSADPFPLFVNRYSNQREIFYINSRSLQPGSDSYTAVLAHEFAHMIYWNENPREGSWINEGTGDLAMQLNGFPQNPHDFVRDPDVQLNAWAESGSGQLPHYAASYLFLSYLVNRFGDTISREIVSSGTHDIASIQQALNKASPGFTFDEVFADWVVANYVDEPELGTRYNYLDHLLGIRPQQESNSFPYRHEGTVHQYGTDYIELAPQGRDLSITFQGDAMVRAIPPSPHGGEMVWWSNRADESDTRLTREFDLTRTKNATLSFWTWYDIEANFDYAYIEASTDGKNWKTLPGRSTTMQDPNSANYGNGFTCKSGSGCSVNARPPGWIQEQVDLSPYAGSRVSIRFEYVTDAIFAAPGIAIDDISIPEINFSDGAEAGDNGWQAEGFARIDNELPQRFIVQAIGYGRDGRVLKIAPVSLDDKNHGTFAAHDLGQDLSKIVIAISGSTPITWEVAHYTLDAK